jgi:hypothetical protein
MKKLLILISILFFFSCDVTEPDTTPPTVTITYPTDNSTVYEVVTITCISTDNEGVEMVELWVDGVSTNIVDDSEPYSLNWNTTTYENGSTHTITIRSYDTNDNKTDSSPMTLIVDNSNSFPSPVNINSIVFENGSFTITWNQSTDGDFSHYELEKSNESMMNNFEVIYSSEQLSDTIYTDTNIDPLNYQYYRLNVVDTLNYNFKSNILSSTLDPIPSLVNITSVNYDLEEMVITWEESSELDFMNYKLLYSMNQEGDKDTLMTYSDWSITSHTLTDFNPTYQNWFWIMVTDTLEQSSLGNGMSNQVNTFPNSIIITSIEYNLDSMVVNWEQSNEWDFVSYELLYSDSQNGDYQSIYLTNDITSTSYTIYDFNPLNQRWYWINVKDYWNQSTIGQTFLVLDNPPSSITLNPIQYYNDSLYVSWSENIDFDFYSYTIYESTNENMSVETPIVVIGNSSTTNYTMSIEDGLERYYRVEVSDYWGLTNTSSIESIDNHLLVGFWVERSTYYCTESGIGTYTTLLEQEYLFSQNGNFTNIRTYSNNVSTFTGIWSITDNFLTLNFDTSSTIWVLEINILNYHSIEFIYNDGWLVDYNGEICTHTYDRQ